MELAAAISLRDRDWGEVHQDLKSWARPVGGPGEGSGALQDTAPRLFPGAPQLTHSGPSDPGQGELEGPGEEAGICLLPHSPHDSHHSTNCWMNPPTKGRSLTVSHSLIVGRSVTVDRLGAGPTAAPTNG